MFGKSIRYLLVTACIMASTSALAQADSDASPACGPPVELSTPFFPREDTRRRAVIVFVHGVLGDRVSTWREQNWIWANKFWPCFLEGGDFKDANVYLHGFNSEALSSSPSIDDAARRLFSDLSADGIFSRYAHVAFVAHSMGGLIVTRSLILNHSRDNDLRKVRFVHFFGTPGKGASVAKIVDFFSGNIQFRDLGPSDRLATYVEEWKALSQRFSIRSFCAAEQRGFGLLGGNLLVSQESAAALCSGRFQPVQQNHSNMVKPSGPGEEAHHLLRNAYMACIKSRIAAPAKTEAASPEGQQAIEWSIQTLALFNKGRNPAGVDHYTEIFGRLATGAGGARIGFTAPDSGKTSLDPAFYRVILNDGPFVQEFLREMDPRANGVTLDTVFRFKDLPNHVKTSDAADFVDDKAHRTGQLRMDDLVISLRLNGDDSDSRVLLFLNPKSELDTNPYARLKGFALQPKTTECG